MLKNNTIQEPKFWDKYLADLPLCARFKAFYPVIKKEVLEFLKLPHALHDYPQYKVYYDSEEGINLYDNIWKAAPLSKYEDEFIDTEKNTPESHYARAVVAYAKEQCPTIEYCIKELEAQGHLRNAFISKLEPGSVIHPHRGRSNEYMRVHLCIVDDPMCIITVGDETRTWIAGEILAFKDGEPYLHSVKHEGDRERIILSVDIKLDYLDIATDSHFCKQK